MPKWSRMSVVAFTCITLFAQVSSPISQALKGRRRNGALTRNLKSCLTPTTQVHLFLFQFPFGLCGWGFGDSAEKVKLQDVQVLTLHHGRMTTGRRSSPVPQLKCVGGSAQGAFTPKVVQCYNRGWDGQDVQVGKETMLA